MTIDEIRRKNLELLISECGSLTALAAAIGRSDSQVSQWVNASVNSGTGNPRGMRSDSCRRIETMMHKPKGWMDAPNDTIRPDHNVSPLVKQRPPVPLISWVQAGAWTEIVDNFAPGDAESWWPCPSTHGPNAFALRVRGVSMEPKFKDGSIIFVDPDRQADHGSNVVVRLDDEKEATFKQLVIEGDRRFLRPLNPSWPEQLIPINGNATICGVVIGQYIPE